MAANATLLLRAGAMLAAMALVAAAGLPTLADTTPGLWEISGVPGTRAPVRQCIGDVAALARFEHRGKACSVRVLKNAGSSASFSYSCGAAGFGRSEIEVITPRSLRISTQGISDGLPFNYVLQARRVDECPKTTASRH